MEAFTLEVISMNVRRFIDHEHVLVVFHAYYKWVYKDMFLFIYELSICEDFPLLMFSH